MTARRLDYPVFLDWVETNTPAHCELVDIPLGLDYLRSHPELLFPTHRVLPRWYGLIQHKGQRQFYRERGLGVLFVGRRKADGNFIRGSAADGYMMARSDGQRVSSPIADWSHEHILAFLRKYNVPLPPIYRFPDGWRQGTHLWCCRLSLGSEQENWNELYSFVPDIVHYAASELSGARYYLEHKR